MLAYMEKIILCNPNLLDIVRTCCAALIAFIVIELLTFKREHLISVWDFDKHFCTFLNDSLIIFVRKEAFLFPS